MADHEGDRVEAAEDPLEGLADVLVLCVAADARVLLRDRDAFPQAGQADGTDRELRNIFVIFEWRGWKYGTPSIQLKLSRNEEYRRPTIIAFALKCCHIISYHIL